MPWLGVLPLDMKRPGMLVTSLTGVNLVSFTVFVMKYHYVKLSKYLSGA